MCRWEHITSGNEFHELYSKSCLYYIITLYMWSSVRQNLGKLHKFQKNLEDKIKSVEVSSSSDFTNFRFFYFLEIFNLLSHFFLLITAVLLAFSSPTFLAFVFMIATVLLTLTLNCLASLLYCPPAPLAKFQLWIV